jgi:hypothetical protein
VTSCSAADGWMSWPPYCKHTSRYGRNVTRCTGVLRCQS